MLPNYARGRDFFYLGQIFVFEIKLNKKESKLKSIKYNYIGVYYIER